MLGNNYKRKKQLVYGYGLASIDIYKERDLAISTRLTSGEKHAIRGTGCQSITRLSNRDGPPFTLTHLVLGLWEKGNPGLHLDFINKVFLLSFCFSDLSLKINGASRNELLWILLMCINTTLWKTALCVNAKKCCTVVYVELRVVYMLITKRGYSRCLGGKWKTRACIILETMCFTNLKDR